MDQLLSAIACVTGVEPNALSQIRRAYNSYRIPATRLLYACIHKHQDAILGTLRSGGSNRSDFVAGKLEQLLAEVGEPGSGWANVEQFLGLQKALCVMFQKKEPSVEDGVKKKRKKSKLGF